MTHSGKFPPNAQAPGLPGVEFLRRNTERHFALKRTITATFGPANTAFRVRHGLGVTPAGYSVVDQDGAAIVYRDPATPKADRFFLYLKCDQANATVRIEVF